MTETLLARVGGLRIKVRRVEGLPLVAARLWLRAGALREDVGGLSALTGRLLGEGSQRRSFEEITLAAEDRGMLLQSFGTMEAIGLAIDGLAEDHDLILEWLAELALESNFPEDRLRWLRRQAVAELRAQLDQPEVRTAHTFLRSLYGDHPYGRPLTAEAKSLRRVSRARCRRFLAQAWQTGGSLAVAGELEPEQTLARLLELFAGLPEPNEKALPELAPPATATTTVTLKNADQAHVYAGHLTVDRAHSDMPALELVAVILGAGAGLSGRLPERIRDRDGLAYAADVACTSGAGLAPGRLVVYAGTSPANVGKVEKTIREELERLVEDGIKDVELEEARAYLLGREPFRHETLRQWVDLMADADFYGVPSDQPGYVAGLLKDLDRAQVEAAIRRWIKPQNLHFTIGQPKAL